ncbi:MAG: cytidylate kinase-like family protein [candidate division Zixibacteria bacterium]|nr:cytidylate kinase-like family protein [candidate division Zixibacteria bacterium]MBU1471833.1 cytidylate kinase-like family protein [candidate division Zixibacteria bacterium]MBU2625717.1 cytidylate kinase-like family protein [candidate division Zixibacteria bacterium]
MQIISISRGSQSGGTEFATDLANKLGYECISREDLLEEATRQKIPVGKLETSIVKPHIFSERLAIELEHYKALATSILCEKALDHDIIYHGRTGHLLLPGVDNVLRIRVVTSDEQRIASVMSRLNLSRNRAKQYIEAVEEDRRKWVRKCYNVEWDVFTLYDVVLNLSQVHPANAAAAICSMAQLPEFQSTPASRSALRDLLLAARARLALLRDDKTRPMNLKLMANKGVLHVTYSFQHVDDTDAITGALHSLTGATEIVCTEAQSNILWIQESFDPDDSAYGDVLSLANSWDAAVEVIKMTPGEDFARYPVRKEIAKEALGYWLETGIIDEVEELNDGDPTDISRVYEKLITDGRAGGKRIIEGSRKTLLNAIDRSRDYRLIVLDNMFLSKTTDTRKHMTQEWVNALSESLKTPVVSMKEIQQFYRFGAKQVFRMAFFAILSALILAAIFHFDDQIMALLMREGTSSRILATTCIVIFIPIFAYVYSSAVGLFLRMIQLD